MAMGRVSTRVLTFFHDVDVWINSILYVPGIPLISVYKSIWKDLEVEHMYIKYIVNVVAKLLFEATISGSCQLRNAQ